ncbi:MAG: hypothetical protein Q9227_005338 [Pyrenula ochraceoflavens]
MESDDSTNRFFLSSSDQPQAIREQYHETLPSWNGYPMEDAWTNACANNAASINSNQGQAGMHMEYMPPQAANPWAATGNITTGMYPTMGHVHNYGPVLSQGLGYPQPPRQYSVGSWPTSQSYTPQYVFDPVLGANIDLNGRTFGGDASNEIDLTGQTFAESTGFDLDTGHYIGPTSHGGLTDPTDVDRLAMGDDSYRQSIPDIKELKLRLSSGAPLENPMSVS